MRFPTNKLMSILICSFPVIACANNTNSGSMPLDTASVRFNRDALRGFGIDDSVAAYFAKGMRFTPGEHRVKLTINGMTSGNVKVNFNRDGELCVGEQWMQQLGVKVPEFDADNQSTENCQPIKKVYANAVVNYSPDSQNVELIVPAEALLDPTGTRPTGYATGGTALKVNYSLLRSDSEYSDNKDTYTSAGLESSLSIADWRLSNSTMYSTSDNGKNNLDNIYTYVEHTFAASATNLQAGGINLATPMLSGAPIYGVQFMPDPALTQSGAGGVDVSGVARSAQARIEIKQNGQLIYTSLVPAGPFTLRSVPVQNRSSDLHVTVVESDGQESHFTVFSSAFRLPVTAMPSWLFAVGRIRDVADADDQPMVASGAWSQPLFRYYNGTVSSILSEDYQAIGGGLELPPFGSMITSLQLRGAQDNNHNEKGSQAGISVNGQLPLGLSFSVADTWSSRGYRDLLDSVRNVDISRD